uniref:Uncharacterized protein n=1 Tax=Lepeophtheirus salmonis TaxID=72036 RepID=A0A0K2UTL4_LEPSM
MSFSVQICYFIIQWFKYISVSGVDLLSNHCILL